MSNWINKQWDMCVPGEVVSNSREKASFRHAEHPAHRCAWGEDNQRNCHQRRALTKKTTVIVHQTLHSLAYSHCDLASKLGDTARRTIMIPQRNMSPESHNEGRKRLRTILDGTWRAIRLYMALIRRQKSFSPRTRHKRRRI